MGILANSEDLDVPVFTVCYHDKKKQSSGAEMHHNNRN